MEIRDSDSHQCAVGHRNGTGSDQLYGVKNCGPQEAKGHPERFGCPLLFATETAKAAKRSSLNYFWFLDTGLPVFIETRDITIEK